MPGIAISGGGVTCGALNTKDLVGVLGLRVPASASVDSSFANTSFKEIVRRLAREDRSIVTEPSALCLMTAMDAFDMAERSAPISAAQRQNMAVYTSAERDREFPAELWQMVHNSGRPIKPSVEDVLTEIGALREVVHPLALFKKLSTNTLYHLSKYFEIQGGGYPFQRMSLGGICMIEEAAAKISRGSCDGALLSAYGNMDAIDNRIAFAKMDLVRHVGCSDGILPSRGSASVVIESLDQLEQRGGLPLAVIDRVYSRFHDGLHASSDDWLTFYRKAFPDLEGSSPFIVRYDNGIYEAGIAEKCAIGAFFDAPETIGYKDLTGYTGQPNNLIDLVLAMFDPAVPVEQPILLNGVGSSSGIGAILFRKLTHACTMTERAA